VIFVDSNVPMYLVGAAHPKKDAARFRLEQVIAQGDRLVTDAEVLQEILRCYHAIGRPDAIQPAFDALLGVVDEVFPVERVDVERAKDLMLGLPGLTARDAVHAAVMKGRRVTRLLSFDTGFDRVAGIERV
jgi:predicted nucleic acid-binding protein